MKEVSIYTVSGIKEPRKINGCIGYVLEYYPENSRYPKTLKAIEPVTNMSKNSSELEALIRALKRMREKCLLTIYTESEYLYEGYAENNYVKQWKKNGWQKSRGGEIANCGQWKEIDALLQGNLYRFLLKENNAYTFGLEYEAVEQTRNLNKNGSRAMYR